MTVLKPSRGFLAVHDLDLDLSPSMHAPTLLHMFPFSYCKAIMLTKETTNVTKKISSCSKASAHPTLPSSTTPIPRAYPDNCLRNIDIGCTCCEHPDF